MKRMYKKIAKLAMKDKEQQQFDVAKTEAVNKIIYIWQSATFAEDLEEYHVIVTEEDFDLQSLATKLES